MLTQNHHMFRESLRNFIDKEINPFIEEWDDACAFPAKDIFKKLGDQGYLGLAYPKEYCGLELDYYYTMIWAEELGRIDCGSLAMSLSVQTDMCTPALNKYGSAFLKKEYLQPSILGDKIGAIALTEENAGSDLLNIALQATQENDNFILNGKKVYITNGGIADYFVVLCNTGQKDEARELSLLIVPSHLPGLTITSPYKKLGNLAASHAEIIFQDVKVPINHIIGERGMGYKIQMEQFQSERLMLSIINYSRADEILKTTRKYVKERNMFGNELIKHQSIAFQLVELFTDVEFLKQMIWKVINSFTLDNECTCEIAMIKYKSSVLVRAAADLALQLHGGSGYMKNQSIIRNFRDTRSSSIAGGTDEIMKYIITRFL